MTIRELIRQLALCPESYEVKICVMDQSAQRVLRLDPEIVSRPAGRRVEITCFIDVTIKQVNRRGSEN